MKHLFFESLQDANYFFQKSRQHDDSKNHPLE